MDAVVIMTTKVVLAPEQVRTARFLVTIYGGGVLEWTIISHVGGSLSTPFCEPSLLA